MTTYISINKQVVAQNSRRGQVRPPIAVRTSKSGPAVYCHRLRIDGPSALYYTPGRPILKCGARLVLVTESEVYVEKRR